MTGGGAEELDKKNPWKSSRHAACKVPTHSACHSARGPPRDRGPHCSHSRLGVCRRTRQRARRLGSRGARARGARRAPASPEIPPPRATARAGGARARPRRRRSRSARAVGDLAYSGRAEARRHRRSSEPEGSAAPSRACPGDARARRAAATRARARELRPRPARARARAITRARSTEQPGGPRRAPRAAREDSTASSSGAWRSSKLHRAQRRGDRRKAGRELQVPGMNGRTTRRTQVLRASRRSPARPRALERGASARRVGRFRARTGRRGGRAS